MDCQAAIEGLGKPSRTNTRCPGNCKSAQLGQMGHRIPLWVRYPPKNRDSAGIATGYVIIKDITTSVSVNASYDAPSSIINSTLYIDRDDTYISRVSYAGGVVGIFDVKKVVDTAKAFMMFA